VIEKQDYIDFSTVPQSKGLGKGTMVVLFTGLIAIFFIGGLSIGFAYYGHIWPSTHSMRIDLGKMPSHIQ
jgi:hypothetical protein